MIFAALFAVLASTIAGLDYCDYAGGPYKIVHPVFIKQSKPFVLADVEADLDVKGSKIAQSGVDAVADTKGKEVFLEAYQFGKGDTGVFLKSSIGAQLLDCKRIRTIDALKIFYKGKFCLAPVHQQVKTFCVKYYTESFGRLLAGAGTALKTTTALLNGDGAAVTTYISFKVRSFLFLAQSDKAVFGKSKASSDINVTARGGKIDGFAQTDNSATSKGAQSKTKLKLSVKSGGKRRGF